MKPKPTPAHFVGYVSGIIVEMNLHIHKKSDDYLEGLLEGSLMAAAWSGFSRSEIYREAKAEAKAELRDMMSS